MVRTIARRILYREKADSETYISYLKRKGVRVGSNVTIFSPQHSLVDLTCPWMLSIGDYVKISHGVIILTHDYAWSVLTRIPESRGRILGAQSPVSIGNNVYIGMNAIITRGVTVGDNVIIGAGSIVTKDCESNSVYAGSPAKKIMTIAEYLNKRDSLQFAEARKIARCYYERFGKRPTEEVFNEYFMLFCCEKEAENVPAFVRQMKLCGTFADSEAYMPNHIPMFSSFEAFLDACFDDVKS